MDFKKPTIESVKIDFPDEIISVNGTIIEKEDIEEMINSLIECHKHLQWCKQNYPEWGTLELEMVVKALKKVGCADATLN